MEKKIKEWQVSKSLDIKSFNIEKKNVYNQELPFLFDIFIFAFIWTARQKVMRILKEHMDVFCKVLHYEG